MDSVSSAWNYMKDAAGSLGTTISDAVSKAREKLTGQPPTTGQSIPPVLGGRRSRKGKRRNKNNKSKKRFRAQLL